MSVLVLHADAGERARITAGLRERGIETHEALDVDGALDVADRVPIRVVLASSAILEAEPMDVGTRIGVRTGQNPKVVALTHLADPARKKALAIHDAALLARPVEDLDALAATTTAMLAVATAPAKPDPSLGKMKVERLAMAPAEDLSAPARPDGKPAVAMVIDDDELIREMIKDILSPRGYVVETFSSASGALRFLGKNPAVSVILSDLNMTQMDGLELKQSLPDAAKKIPFILVTGESEREHKKIADSIGVDAFVPKPLQAKALCKLVRDVIVAKRV